MFNTMHIPAPPGLSPPGLTPPPGLSSPTCADAFQSAQMRIAAMTAANAYLAQENMRLQALHLEAIHRMAFGGDAFLHTPVAKSRDAAKSWESTCAGSSVPSTCGDDSAPEIEEVELTTMIIRNVPTNITRAMLMQALDDAGFAGRYNFVNLPLAYDSQKGFGYAFVNFESGSVAEAFSQKFTGFNNWPVKSDLVAKVDVASGGQGLEAQIERYRNSPAMHDSVSDLVKPVLLQKGVRIPFPPPTKVIEAPRLRRRKP
jgi:hypothetical protein